MLFGPTGTGKTDIIIRIAKTLGISIDQVNVKATTEERLGFTGREEGIASQAICSLTGFYEASIAVGGNCAGCSGCAKN